ncbi:response regulator transcription factor [Salmonella enterica]|nr:response regulator transcription factor [Salmonella enterica]EGM2345331.1 response regulator transcription factor [Salmonella enterica]EGM2364166.1 response regulator transcription factor [Salmonella enterica]
MRILLVEDDSMIGDIVADSLKDASFAVDWVQNGHDALSGLKTQHYDVILLDLGLPGKDGFSVLDGIRKADKGVAVLIISARDALEDRLRGLNNGADDYIIKPFDLSELLARIHAVLRRKNGNGSPVLANGTMMLDPVSHEVRIVASGQSFLLSNREYAVLEALMLRPGGILSRSDLEDRIYGWGEEVESNAIEFLIHSLRKKIGRDAIRNVRGVGWLVSKNE